jgi:transcriptional regulator CtsR
MIRGTSLDLWQRVRELVIWSGSPAGMNRHELADRWECTPRNVSHIIDVARTFYGVEVESERNADGRWSYRLRDPGVLDLNKLRKRGRRTR